MILIACSVFRNELEMLRARGDIDFPVRYLDSMLHMQPGELHRRLTSLLKAEVDKGNEILLLYGDCHVYMNEYELLPGVYRVKGLNCAQILLGPDQYRKLSHEKTFFFMPEWMLRWREVFEKKLGLNKDFGRDFMQSMHRKFLYIDTGCTPVPAEELQSASDTYGLPWDIVRVGSDHLLAAIHEAVNRISENG